MWNEEESIPSTELVKVQAFLHQEREYPDGWE
jgi:hypothetical protein